MTTTLEDIAPLIRAALAEDIGTGDATSESIFTEEDTATGTFTAKSSGVVAGISVAAMVFTENDPTCRLMARLADGETVHPGAVLATVEGPARALLSAERTALNFLQRMSGIATATRAFVDAVRGTGCTILDTRKTAPGLRRLDKMAVTMGGGGNHRHGLYDMVLIKDNHIDAAGSIRAAVERVRGGTHATLPIEVECRTLEDVQAAIGLAVDRIMLDNMDIATIREAVRVNGGRVPLEASGNVSLDTVRLYAETGVSYVSVGALTHSVRALDISLTLGPLPPFHSTTAQERE